jgi:peroxiredoxin
MKTKTLLTLMLVAVVMAASAQSNETESYLKTVLKNLEAIQSATYHEEGVVWTPYETAPLFIQNHYVKEFDNPVDTTIGASFIELLANDTSRIALAYDGAARVLVDDDKKTLEIDSFNVDRGVPFRLVSPPFYNYTKNIIRYMLTTTDSITVEPQESDTTLHVILTIHEDRNVEFFGKAYKNPFPPMFGNDPTSRYEIWIDKRTNLPFKCLREMSHNKSQSTVSNPVFNKVKIDNFSVADYFPADYEIIDYKERMERQKMQKADVMEGTVAPDFLLTGTHGNQVSLKEIQSEVVLLHFTGIGCGPCLLSIPFMEKISKEYSPQQLTVLSIETWGNKMNTLKNYQAKHQFTYTFLQGNSDVTKAYNAMGVPRFFVLDKNYVIRKVFNGYDDKNSDNEIKKVIDALLK